MSLEKDLCVKCGQWRHPCCGVRGKGFCGACCKNRVQHQLCRHCGVTLAEHRDIECPHPFETQQTGTQLEQRHEAALKLLGIAMKERDEAMAMLEQVHATLNHPSLSGRQRRLDATKLINTFLENRKCTTSAT